MAATHPGYNVIKMPGSGGILSVAGDTKDAAHALKLTYKAAATVRPGTGDTAQASEGIEDVANVVPMKKKQLFSQSRAETKQVPVDEGNPGPTFTIGADLA